MSEYYAFDAKYMCRACVKTGEDLCLMSADEILLYEKFVQQETIQTKTIMKICFICRCIFSKLQRFLLQCQKTNEVMNGMVKVNLSTKPHNYTCTTSIYYMGPELEESDLNGYPYDHNDISDEDIPLLMLRDNVKEDEVKVKKKRKKEVESELVAIENTQKAEGKKNKQKKKLKEGFSSRMVQETNEYEVIKLSKEQVLQEMEEKSKSDKYLRSVYKCEKCVKGFNFKDVIDNHMKKHSQKVLQEMEEKSKSDKYLRSVYKCEKCVKGFNFKDVIDNHMKKHSQEHGILKCEICAQYCPSSVSLRGHLKSHTTRYKCKICGAVRISRQHLLEHYSIEHTFDASTYTCDHCPFTTTKRTVIQRHVKSHKSGRNLRCTMCPHTFNNMHALRMHLSRHDPSQRFSCPQCNMKFIYPSLLHRHMRSHSHRDHYCVECDVTFKSLDNLKLHFKRAKKHRDPSTYKYKCSQCDERFISPSSVLAHLTTSHGAAKSHACTLCGKLYSSRESVRSHERRAHANTEGEGFNHKKVSSRRLRTQVDSTFCFPTESEKYKREESTNNQIQAVHHET